jgi:hypothetical protein
VAATLAGFCAWAGERRWRHGSRRSHSASGCAPTATAPRPTAHQLPRQPGRPRGPAGAPPRAKGGGSAPGRRVVDQRRERSLQEALAMPSYHLLLCGPAESWNCDQLAGLGERYAGLVTVHRLARKPAAGVPHDVSREAFAAAQRRAGGPVPRPARRLHRLPQRWHRPRRPRALPRPLAPRCRQRRECLECVSRAALKPRHPRYPRSLLVAAKRQVACMSCSASSPASPTSRIIRATATAS